MKLTPAQFFGLVLAVAVALEEVIRLQLLPAEWTAVLSVLVVFAKAYLKPPPSQLPEE